MILNVFLKALVWTSLLEGVSLAMPSSNDNGLDARAILPLNGMLSPRSEPLEIRGVYGGRKKRYIIETRAPKKCCKKITCKPLLGEYLNNDCKCTKCKAGRFPSEDGRLCVDKCPEGKPNGKGGCCIGKDCEGGDNNRDNDKDRQGKCPDGQILDIKEGGQTPNTPNPKCAIDDSKKCPKGQVPRTRFDGLELDPEFEIQCGDAPEDTECRKGRFKDVSVWSGSDGKSTARIECLPTRKFERKKEDTSKSKEFRDRQKDDWNKRKPQRDEQQAERKKYKDKLEEREKEIEKYKEAMRKIDEKFDRMRARMGKCAPVSALMYAVSEATSEDENSDETESPYDWTTDYFDEAFVDSGEFLKYWPDDLNVEDIEEVTDEGVDADAWMRRWEEIISARQLRNGAGNCGGSLKRSEDIDRRCIAKRSIGDDDLGDFGDIHVFNGNDTLYERYMAAEVDAYGPPSDLMIRDPNYIAARNPVAFIAEIIIFAIRLGTSLLARTAQALARYSPRLAHLAKNTDRLFKVAPKGSRTPRGVEGMKNAMSHIFKNWSWRQCILEGIP